MEETRKRTAAGWMEEQEQDRQDNGKSGIPQFLYSIRRRYHHNTAALYVYRSFRYSTNLDPSPTDTRFGFDRFGGYDKKDANGLH